tara:strand:+ start:270 stop:962 length:693 start_codon:yes stop_codon:yes gene_type:complete
MNELPTDIWREIIDMSKMTIKDKIDEVGTIKELIEVDSYLMNKIEQSIKEFKSQFKSFDILEYFDEDQDRTIYLLYAYQEHPRKRYINCFEVIPSQYYTLYGKFIPKDINKLVDITDKDIKIHKSKKDIDNERKQIKVNVNDIFIHNIRLWEYNNYNVYLNSLKECYNYYDDDCKYLLSIAKRITKNKIYTECGKVIDRKFVVVSYSDYDNNNKNEKLIEYLNAIKKEHF